MKEITSIHDILEAIKYKECYDATGTIVEAQGKLKDYIGFRFYIKELSIKELSIKEQAQEIIKTGYLRNIRNGFSAVVVSNYFMADKMYIGTANYSYEEVIDSFVSITKEEFLRI